MNLAKVFRRHQPKESPSPNPKKSEKSPFIHPFHGYPRPFSYHIPPTEQLSPLSLTKTPNRVLYRIGLSSDSGLLTNGQTNENDDIVRLPIKNGKGQSPKSRKDRRCQSQLNANKRWLYRSMETLDGWKEKVFTPKNRTNDSSQSRSRSVENLADDNILMNKKPSAVQQYKRAISPNQSIEVITNHVINNMDIHRKSTTPTTPNHIRSPALTIEKQSLSNHSTNDHNSLLKQHNHNNNNNETHPSAILDFREISAFGYLHSSTRLNDDNQNTSLTNSENIFNSLNLSDDENDDAVISNLSCGTNSYDRQDDSNNETIDPWDLNMTWIDSLKEQHSPQRKIEFYENLIKLLEQDTLNIDELLVLRKVLTKIWPLNETSDPNNQLFSFQSKPNITKSLNDRNKIKQRPKLSTMTHHTAKRCSSIIEQNSLFYEPLHEKNSGHNIRPSSLLIAAKATPCIIENSSESNSIQSESLNGEQNYPQHLNPFTDETDLTPTNESDSNKNNESIRRYFERLTLLETIYEKLNGETNKGPSLNSNNHQKLPTEENHPNEKRIETKDIVKNHSNSHTSNNSILNTNKPVLNKFVEMNVDGNGSVSSGKSSVKRRAPTAPHLIQNDKKHQVHPTNSNMFLLSSKDLNLPFKPNQDTNKSIGLKSYDEKSQRDNDLQQPAQDSAAACDDEGHVFVYDSPPNPISNQNNVEQPIVTSKQIQRIQQWLSSCDRKQELNMLNNSSPTVQSTSPTAQFKMRCVSKPIRQPSSSPPLPLRYQEDTLPTITIDDLEPTRFRSCLKINLDKNQTSNQRTRASSATTKYHPRNQFYPDESFNIIDNDEYFEINTSSPSFKSDPQAVYL